MNKSLLAGAVVIGPLAVARRFGSEVPNVDGEERLERTPDNAPPKSMFANITAIRENTDRILEIRDGKPAVEEQERAQ